MDQRTFENARADLVRIGLIAWKHPLYQVLCIEQILEQNHQPTGSSMSLGQILRNAMEVRHD
jgi:hypothetical protein